VRNGAEELPDVVDEELRLLPRGKCPPRGISRPATALFRDARTQSSSFLSPRSKLLLQSVGVSATEHPDRTIQKSLGLSVILRVIATELAAT
jgi:hypothetical protein